MAKEREENEVFENPEVLAEQINKSEEFLKKNKIVLIGALAAVAVIIAGFTFWKSSSETNELEAAQELYKAEYFFGLDSLDLALNGSDAGDGFSGLEEVASEYSGTNAGNLAYLYAGAAYLKKGDSDKAKELLSNFDGDGFLVSAQAYGLAGDAYLESKDPENAIKFYKKAVKSKPNKEFTPKFLVKLALAQEEADDLAGAVLSYESFVKEYPRDKQIDDVKKYLAKAKMLASKKS